MPFKSLAQRKFMFKKKPKLAKKWVAKYGSGGKNLPEKISDVLAKKGGK